MTIRATLAFAAVLAAGSAFAAPSMTYTPVSCVRSGEMPLMQLSIEGDGDLTGFFRRTGSTDWCSVEGVNEGPLSRVILPKFNSGDEIEYFFVLTEGRRVLARSQEIYRVRVGDSCAVPFARHVLPLMLSCGDAAQTLPSAMGAAYSMSAIERPRVSPESPEEQ